MIYDFFTSAYVNSLIFLISTFICTFIYFFWLFHRCIVLLNMPQCCRCCKWPEIDRCCFCIKDFKVATGLITLLAIVTNPVIAWAIVRHSYVIRVACFLTTRGTAPDVVDIKLYNLVSFGFGANAGLAPSCLGVNSTLNAVREPENETFPPFFRTTIDDNIKIPENLKKGLQSIQKAIRTIGWIVLCVDVVYLFICFWFFRFLFLDRGELLIKWFMAAMAVSIFWSYVYGVLYVVVCSLVSGNFPVFEFSFTHVDLLLWTYFWAIVNTYRKGDVVRG